MKNCPKDCDKSTISMTLKKRQEMIIGFTIYLGLLLIYGQFAAFFTVIDYMRQKTVIGIASDINDHQVLKYQPSVTSRLILQYLTIINGIKW